MQSTSTSMILNGLDTGALRQCISRVSEAPAAGMTRWQVTSRWMGGARSDTHVNGYEIGGRRVEKDFTIRIDEPLEIGGTNQFANPQEYLLAAMNACIIVTYVAICALEGIELEDLRIETDGNIDLRGLYALDPEVRPGYDEVRYTVYIKGSATPEQFQKVHQMVMATSPNYDNLARAIPLRAKLVVH